MQRIKGASGGKRSRRGNGDEELEVREGSGAHRCARRAAARQLRHQLEQHLRIAGLTKTFAEHQRPAPRLAQGVLQLTGPVSGVDRDQHQTGTGRGKLRQHPLDAVDRPDADPIPRFEPQGEQGSGKASDCCIEFRRAQAYVLMTYDQRLGLGPALRRIRQGSADRLVAQGL